MTGFPRFLAGALVWGTAMSARAELPPAAERPVDFVRDIRPIFQRACVDCHGPEKQRSDYRLDMKRIALTGGEAHAPNILPGNSAGSPLIHFISRVDTDTAMPPKGDPLSVEEIGLIRRWIDDGAVWPDSASVAEVKPLDWWSLKPLARPTPPPGPEKNPVDAFLNERLRAAGLTAAPPADRRELCRRVYYDLTGLPPSPEEMDAFLASEAPDAYERLVDRLLASPRHGERMARHWLDVVHYGETHGYDKDKPRPNAWPYRDYVIRAFNSDMPYGVFVREQIAGDVLFPGTRDGVEALGFLAAGPWDFIGHAEVTEDKTDGKIARHLDRDDMVATTMNTFCAVTAQCAQCHNHKFDPVSAEDYYSLQSVFAALDRTDVEYDTDPEIAAERATLTEKRAEAAKRRDGLVEKARAKTEGALTALDRMIESAAKPGGEGESHGWHSEIAESEDKVKSVTVDLGKSVELKRVTLHPCHDDFNNIGDGFGFPARFRVELSDDAGFKNGVLTVLDETEADFPNPGIKPVVIDLSAKARHIRVTATKLAPRVNDFIFSLAEITAVEGDGVNQAAGARVSSADSIEAPPRWSRANLTDSLYPGGGAPPAADREKLAQARRLVLEAALGPKGTTDLAAAEAEVADLDARLAKLPPKGKVYAGAIHTGSGPFRGTGGNGGKPRPVYVLSRGDVKRPGREAAPGALSALDFRTGRFPLPADAPEGARRAALADWITDPANPLTWRVIVNRIWQTHFGRGLAETSSDFGRMGMPPSHLELLDWLAVTFRDDMGGSLKALHRLIVTSDAYRRSSTGVDPRGPEMDAANTLLWRQNRRRLGAEEVRDSILSAAGRLDLTMGGPSFQDFTVDRPEHSPHYLYELADPDNPALWRRSIYRFLVRSRQQPLMAALDCADPSMAVDRRNETITPLQALAQLNNSLVVVMAQRFAERLDAEGKDPAEKIRTAFRLALQRDPSPEESAALTAHAAEFGLANTCRLILNLNEFVFID